MTDERCGVSVVPLGPIHYTVYSISRLQYIFSPVNKPFDRQYIIHREYRIMLRKNVIMPCYPAQGARCPKK